ncbi:hypothetical protein ACH5RR_036812 [Cinchona calisaya]|uniref:Uncharacterized protein n=1 Tax=Cinchona calisaya TaxID=153742 RepID=A0ABD2Y4C1_9GENT
MKLWCPAHARLRQGCSRRLDAGKLCLAELRFPLGGWGSSKSITFGSDPNQTPTILASAKFEHQSKLLCDYVYKSRMLCCNSGFSFRQTIHAIS